jgi:hypothetical protein
MSVVTFDWAPAETETKISIPAKAVENYSREEEFRLALDRYTVDYVADQRRRDEALIGTVGMRLIRTALARFAGWRGDWRRTLAASREVWLFSQETSRDWRQPGRHR